MSDSTPLMGPPFWDSFVMTDWGQAPALFQDMLPGGLLTTDELFGILLHETAALRTGNSSVRVFSGGRPVARPADLARFVALERDGTFEGYARRIQGVAEHGQFAVVVNGLTRAHRPLWRSLARFFAPLCERVGIPYFKTDASLFIGNYDRTPFGIHRDHAHVFTFPVVGRKRFLLWPARYFSERDIRAAGLFVAQDPSDEVLKDGRPLEAGLHDFAYWPPSHWHVGVAGESGVTASLAAAMYCDLPAVGFVPPLVAMVGSLQKQRDLLRTFRFSQGLKPAELRLGVPREIETVVADLAASCADGSARRAAIHEWLCRLTSLSLAPPAVTAVDYDIDEVKQCADGVVRYIRVSSQELAIGANGHCFATESSPEVEEMLARLATGQPLSLRGLMSDEAQRVLRLMMGSGAIEPARVVNEPGQRT